MSQSIPEHVIGELGDFQGRLLLAVHGIAAAELKHPEAEGKWSILDVIAHLGDVELITSLRIRQILVEDTPALFPFEQEAWIARVPREGSLAALAETFWSLRRSNLQLMANLDEALLQRKGLHARFGAITLAELIGIVHRHQETHLGQIERIKKTLGISVTSVPDVSGVVAGHYSEAPARDITSGIRVRALWRDRVKRALRVELDAGVQWPGLDYHVPGPEEVYVVSGTFDDGENRYPAGTFLHHPAGSSHSPTSPDGCVLFVYYPEG